VKKCDSARAMEETGLSSEMVPNGDRGVVEVVPHSDEVKVTRYED